MPPRHRFLEPIHNVKEGPNAPTSAAAAAKFVSSYLEKSEAPALWGLPSRSRIAAKAGGASRDRTGDLKLAKLALSQLSYGPLPNLKLTSLRVPSVALMVGREGVEPSTSRLSGVRSNHLSYRPQCLPPAMWPRAA